MSSTPGRKCNFCPDQAKYTCPRCQRLYCSTTCYKSKEHDSCAQNFYRQCVLDHLQSQHVDSDTRKEMIAILKRQAVAGGEPDMELFSAEGDDEEDQNDDIVSRFEGVNFEDDSDEMTAQLMARLTEEEQKEFEKLIATGRIADLIPAEISFEPWWLSFKPNLVSEVSAAGFGKSRDLINRLPLPAAVSRKEPSPSLKYCLLNLFISYCYSCRYFNGDHIRVPDEFLEELSETCSVIRDSRAVFKDSETALQDCMQLLSSCKHLPLSMIKQLLEDVRLVVLDKNIVLELLADVWFVIDKCLSGTLNKSKRKAMKLLQKRVEYFIGWSKEKYCELLPLVRDIDCNIRHVSARVEEGGGADGNESLFRVCVK